MFKKDLYFLKKSIKSTFIKKNFGKKELFLKKISKSKSKWNYNYKNF
jgi:hypothetical protein